MSSAARAWLVNDALEQGDVVVVLGGGADSRPFAAAELYKRGYAPVVLVADPSPGTLPAVRRPGRSEGQMAVDRLRRMGVPDSAIVRFGGEVTSTRDEAHGVRRWLEQHRVHRVVIPTDPFHTRRVRFIFERELKGLAVQITVICIPNQRYDPLEWWKSEEATRIFGREIVKLVFYYLTSGLMLT